MILASDVLQGDVTCTSEASKEQRSSQGSEPLVLERSASLVRAGGEASDGSAAEVSRSARSLSTWTAASSCPLMLHLKNCSHFLVQNDCTSISKIPARILNAELT